MVESIEKADGFPQVFPEHKFTERVMQTEFGSRQSGKLEKMKFIRELKKIEKEIKMNIILFPFWYSFVILSKQCNWAVLLE